jgi:hypothetical protein
MGVIMDEMTLWEIIEGFERAGSLHFSLMKLDGGWIAFFGNDPGDNTGKIIFPTRKEALISAITKLTVQ